MPCSLPPLSIEISGPREPSEDMDMSPIELDPKVEDSEEPIPGLTASIRSHPPVLYPRLEVKVEQSSLPGLTQQPSFASPLRSFSRVKAEEIERLTPGLIHIRQQPSSAPPLRSFSPVKAEEVERLIPGLIHIGQQPSSAPPLRSFSPVKAEEVERLIPGLIHIGQQPSSAPPLRSFSPVKAEEVEEPIPGLVHIGQQLSSAPRPVSDMFDLDDDPPVPPQRISKPAPQNSFVSGGFVTDFIGAVTLPTKEGPRAVLEEGQILDTYSALPPNFPASDPPLLSPAQRKKKRQKAAANERRRAKRVRLAQAKLLAAAAGDPPLNDSDVATRSNVAIPVDRVIEARDELTIAPVPPQSQPPPIPAPPRPRAPAQNAVASSSKVISTAPPPPPPLLLPSTSILPRVLSRMKQAPANTDQLIDLTSSPPPEPKVIARIPAGPSSNPLSIRPSNFPLQSTRARPPPFTSTSTVIAATSKAKKKVVVGRGWPFVRAVCTSSSAAAAPAPARSQPVASSSKADLSSIVGYRSPSPYFAPPPVNKWKRIDDEICIGVPPTDVDKAIPSPPPILHPRPEVKVEKIYLPGLTQQPSSAPPLRSFHPVKAEEIEEPIPVRVNKWKRIDDEICIGVPPTDDDEAQTDDDEAMDMVISVPPSPVSEPPPLPPPPSTDTSGSTSLADRISSPVRVLLPDIPLSRQPSSDDSRAQDEFTSKPAVAGDARTDSLLSRLSPPKIRPPALPPSTSGRKTTSASSQARPTAHTASPPKSSEDKRQNDAALVSLLIRIDSDSGGTRPNPRAPTPTQAFNIHHAPIPTQVFSLRPAHDQKQKRPALPTQIVSFAASHNNTAAKPAPPQRTMSQQNRCSVAAFPMHHPLPSKPPPSIALPRGIKRDRPPSPAASSIARAQERRWPTIGVMHSNTLKGDGDLGIRRIAFNSDGSCFALYCRDRTLRIWDNKPPRGEIARLAHNSQVVALAWLDNDAAVMSLAEDGVLGKWTRIRNQWQWGRVINVGLEAGLEIQKRAPEEVVCLAYARDRIAVAFPKSGVKVWMWCKGSWLAQRSIMRPNVTALKFIDGGDALLGGTREGVVWHCAVPNGTMKVYAFLQSSITSISTTHSHLSALVAQAGGSACLLSLGAQDEKRVGQTFLASDVPVSSSSNFNSNSTSANSNASQSKREPQLDAVYATYGKNIVFGVADGCLIVWDGTGGKGKGKEREKADGGGEGGVVCGLEWDDDEWAGGVGDEIQTVAVSCLSFIIILPR
ncbi:hypothetical protein C8F04DRAFT_117410 [Mycena alexandri]|uniref:Uncharacterized protein n=1 Tax=Mycena alexandri TaxID=1745969 RepID=A0AAD6XEB1_9AGAR|nr:hypothetical protein C8F04DRAFT_117410 [Mycena alexandri]